MLESDLEDEVVEWAKQMGGFALKLKIENEQGWPDRTLFLPGATIALPELKRPKGRRRHMQKLWVRRLAALGFQIDFCTSLQQVQDLVSKAR